MTSFAVVIGPGPATAGSGLARAVDEPPLAAPVAVPEHAVVVGSRVRLAVALAMLLSACTVGGQPDSPEPATPEKDATLAACEEHFPDVRDYQAETVGGIRNIGPAIISPPAGPLDIYADDEPVALCLVPNGSGTFDAVAVVLSDGNTVTRWTSNVETLESRPV